MRFWPFSRKSITESTDIATLFAALTGESALESPSSIVKKAPEDNTTVAGGIRQVSTAAWSIPWYVKVPGQGDKLDDAPPNHPVRQLIGEPNIWMPWEGVVEHVISERILHGRAFLLLTNNEVEAPARRGSPPLEILPIPYELVSPIRDPTNFGVLAYRINAGRAQTVVHPDHMVDVWGWSPKGLMQESSDLRSSARSIEAQNVARRWNNMLLRRSARPPGAWISDEELTTEQADKLLEQLEKKHAGAANAGRAMLLWGGLKWQDNAWKPGDMEWIQGIREARREIAIGMGLPPELLGDPEVKTYANAEQARLSLYEDRAFPILRAFAHALRLKLRVWYNDVDFYLDLDAVPAVQARRAELAAKRAQLVQTGILTPNEAREELGYEPIPGGDALMMPMSMVPLGTTDTDEEDPPEGDPDEEAEGEEDPDAEDDSTEKHLVDRVALRATLAKMTNGGQPRVVEH